MWEILIDLDPVNKRRNAKGILELRAENALHEFEVMLMEFEIKKKADDLEYERRLHQQMHARRLRATESETVEAALDTYESQEVREKAERIRSTNARPAATRPVTTSNWAPRGNGPTHSVVD